VRRSRARLSPPRRRRHRRRPRTAGAPLQERREFARQRQTVIAANAELQERELIKLASLASALAEALRQRGVPGPAASLTAEAASRSRGSPLNLVNESNSQTCRSSSESRWTS